MNQSKKYDLILLGCATGIAVVARNKIVNGDYAKLTLLSGVHLLNPYHSCAVYL
ncbi:hypothetical protein [Acinetobacter sp. P1(2025)]|uniref:hypothetical protein n=1 Tax=Acinetobacter sp. P1(2025) TaxID=3446120 RepID=UPI003F53D0AF